MKKSRLMIRKENYLEQRVNKSNFIDELRAIDNFKLNERNKVIKIK